uniref:Ribosomal protein S6 kinase like 1 n=1 Tax=Leptobrachium leishanense TaxID=445787 RepID=A0A8C5WKE7_9ANUR
MTSSPGGAGWRSCIPHHRLAASHDSMCASDPLLLLLTMFQGPVSGDGDVSCRYRVGVTALSEQSLVANDYLVDAAKQLHVALERDANEEYEAAFSHYKHGVELLLDGVTVDPSRERRDAVKRKISQYLKRAEEIFNCHLQRPAGSAWGAGEGYSSLRFRPIRALSGAVENLKHCRVIEIIDKVQLVYDPTSGLQFVLKSLMKSGRSGHGAVTVIPQRVPFMVQLQRFYVSDDSLYLQLQHIPGGRLWGNLWRYQGTRGDYADSPGLARDDECPSAPGVSDREVPIVGVPESQVQVWGAQLVTALEMLHQEGVLCRDLNPRNLLLSDKEVLGTGPVDEACDWWSLGTLLYELLTGQVRPPPSSLYWLPGNLLLPVLTPPPPPAAPLQVPHLRCQRPHAAPCAQRSEPGRRRAAQTGENSLRPMQRRAEPLTPLYS